MEVPLFWVGTPCRFLCTSSLWAPKSQGSLHVALLSPGPTWLPTPQCLRGWVSWPRPFRVPWQPLQTAPAALTAPPPGPIHPPSPAAAPNSERLTWTPATTFVSVLGYADSTTHPMAGNATHQSPPRSGGQKPNGEPQPHTSQSCSRSPCPPPRAVRGREEHLPAPSPARLSPLQDRSPPGNFQPLPEMRAGRDPRASLLACVPEAFPS